MLTAPPRRARCRSRKEKEALLCELTHLVPGKGTIGSKASASAFEFLTATDPNQQWRDAE